MSDMRKLRREIARQAHCASCNCRRIAHVGSSGRAAECWTLGCKCTKYIPKPIQVYAP